MIAGVLSLRVIVSLDHAILGIFKRFPNSILLQSVPFFLPLPIVPLDHTILTELTHSISFCIPELSSVICFVTQLVARYGRNQSPFSPSRFTLLSRFLTENNVSQSRQSETHVGASSSIIVLAPINL